MSTLIDLCGTPISLEHVRNFRLVKRDCLFYPVYQEMQEHSFSLFARKGESNKKKFRFVKMVPFGILLSDKEKPKADSYEIKSFGEVATINILSEVGKAIENVATIAADMFRIDTSGNTELHILTQGRRLTHMKLRDIPAKVSFLSGKVSDVYKNDPIYGFLGEPISPTIVAVPTLVITVDKTTYVFFGGGIDLEDVDATYHELLNAYNQLQESNQHKKLSTSSKISISIPKLPISSIKIQSPFLFQKNEKEPQNLIESVENSKDSEITK